MTQQRQGSFLFLLLLLLVVLAFSCSEIYNLDLGIHLTTGAYIARHHEIPRTNVFSYANADYPVQNDKWLFQVILHAVYSAWGVAGLFLLRLALTVAVFGLLWKTLRLGSGPLLAAALSVLALLISFERLALRPELFSLLLAVSFLYLLEGGRTRGWGRSLWILIPLHVLWVNLHGYFGVGLVLVFAYLVGGFLERRAGRFLDADASGACIPRWVWGVGLLLLPATLVNPSGIRGALYPLTTLRDLAGPSRFMLEAVAEFRSPLDDTTGGIHILLFKAAALVGLGSTVLVRRRLSLPHLLVFLAFLAQAIGMRRNLPLFAVAAAPLLARNLALIAKGAARRIGPSSEERLRAVRRVAAAVFALAVLFLCWASLSDRLYRHVGVPQRTGFGLSNVTYPEGAVDFILSSRLEGQVFNTLDTGAYFLWKAYPDRLPFITGDTNGYGSSFLRAYFDIIRGRADFDAVADEYGITCALLDHTQEYANALIAGLSGDPGWALVWLDGTALVFLRKTAANRDRIEAHRPDLLSRAVWGPAVRRSPRGFLDRWVPWRSDAPRHALYLGRVLLTLRQYAAAESVLVETRRQWPSEKQVLPTLGLAYYYQEQWEKARASLTGAVEAGEDGEVVRVFLGDLDLRSGDLAAARAQFEEGLEKHPGSAALGLGRAVALRRQHRSREAIETVEGVLKGHPENRAARVELGSLYQEAGDYRRAAEQYSALLVLQPEDSKLHETLGFIYSRALGMEERALDHLIAALELHPAPSDSARIEAEISRIRTGGGK